MSRLGLFDLRVVGHGGADGVRFATADDLIEALDFAGVLRRETENTCRKCRDGETRVHDYDTWESSYRYVTDWVAVPDPGVEGGIDDESAT